MTRVSLRRYGCRLLTRRQLRAALEELGRRIFSLSSDAASNAFHRESLKSIAFLLCCLGNRSADNAYLFMEKTCVTTEKSRESVSGALIVARPFPII